MAVGEIILNQLGKERLLELLHQMLLIRRFEEKAAEMYTRGKISGFMHLYIGQEAIGVGAISTLRADDYVISHYREHGQVMARGADPRQVMAELYGKRTGLSKGRGGSMHMGDASRHFLGGYAIVAGQLPLADGVGLAIQYRQEDSVVLAFFGDGAVDEGAWHEALNLAAVWKLPVVFLCENNQYSMGMAIARASAVPVIADRACAYGIPAERVDGMDLIAVMEATRRAVERARAGEGPSLIEALTYRFRGHSMTDPAKYRPSEEEEYWKGRDPLPLLEERLRQARMLDEAELKDLQDQVERTVNEAVAFAESSPPPSPDELADDVCVDDSCPAYLE